MVCWQTLTSLVYSIIVMPGVLQEGPRTNALELYLYFSFTVVCCVYTLTHYRFFVINCRGDSFRRKFSRLGELCSIIPEHVNVMALTAMATVSTRKEIVKSLDMQGSCHCVCVLHEAKETYTTVSLERQVQLRHSDWSVKKVAKQRQDHHILPNLWWSHCRVLLFYISWGEVLLNLKVHLIFYNSV